MAAQIIPLLGSRPWVVKTGTWGRLWHLKHGSYTACIQWWQGRDKLTWRIVKDGQCYSYKDLGYQNYRMTMGQGVEATAAGCIEKCMKLLREFIIEDGE